MDWPGRNCRYTDSYQGIREVTASHERRYKRIAAYAAIYLLWGGVYLSISVLVEVLPPFFVAGFRYSVSAFCLLLIALFRCDPLPTTRQLLNAIWTGAAMLAVGYGVVFWAEQRLASWIVAVVASTTFLWTFLGESLLLRSYRFTFTMLLLLLAGLAGVLLLTWGSPRSHGAISLPVLVVLFGAMCWAGGSLAVKRLEMPQSYIQTAATQLAVSGLILLCVSAGLGEGHLLPQVSQMFTSRSILAMAYLVIAASVVAFTAFHWLIKREPASMVATSTYVNPAVAMLLGIVVAKERCSSQEMCGAVVILGSTIFIWLLQAQNNLPELNSNGSRSSLNPIESARSSRRPFVPCANSPNGRVPPFSTNE